MQGTGLGLPISRQFVRLMGGDIAVSSVVGQGSTFTFNILAHLASEADLPTITTTKRVIGLEPNQHQYRIIVVEDIVENCHLLMTILETVGFEVRSAKNGLEALTIWQDWQPHLIWMDMLMPVMDGYQATKHIKASPKGQETVIIALTAHAFQEEQTAILEAGCDDFLYKPFNEKVLLEKMAHHLGVRYIYEEEKSTVQQLRQKKQDISTEADLKYYIAQMPAEWVEKIYHAACMGSDENLLELIEQIPQEYFPLVNALSELVYNFGFDQIMELTI
jgi:CheY-like chemotaxis protein